MDTDFNLLDDFPRDVCLRFHGSLGSWVNSFADVYDAMPVSIDDNGAGKRCEEIIVVLLRRTQQPVFRKGKIAQTLFLSRDLIHQAASVHPSMVTQIRSSYGLLYLHLLELISYIKKRLTDFRARDRRSIDYKEQLLDMLVTATQHALFCVSTPLTDAALGDMFAYMGLIVGVCENIYHPERLRQVIAHFEIHARLPTSLTRSTITLGQD